MCVSLIHNCMRTARVLRTWVSETHKCIMITRNLGPAEWLKSWLFKTSLRCLKPVSLQKDFGPSGKKKKKADILQTAHRLSEHGAERSSMDTEHNTGT